ncbi:hypothetical protein [Pseudoponticoccus marisrubri]|uniref:hypothetical protein n=1 Tax=Pseudoponticoccus marisrubri TaxID=1685382 RepID=UPI0012FE46A3|nr:hypothetical protein [Pseudoponticoccus marisrubri]
MKNVRKIMDACLFSVFLLSADAAFSHDTSECQGIEDSLERLMCYDSFSETTNEGLGFTNSDLQRMNDIVARGGRPKTSFTIESCVAYLIYDGYSERYKRKQSFVREIFLINLDMRLGYKISKDAFGNHWIEIGANPGATFRSRGHSAKTNESFDRYVNDLAMRFDKDGVREYEVEEFADLLIRAAKMCQS